MECFAIDLVGHDSSNCAVRNFSSSHVSLCAAGEVNHRTRMFCLRPSLRGRRTAKEQEAGSAPGGSQGGWYCASARELTGFRVECQSDRPSFVYRQRTPAIMHSTLSPLTLACDVVEKMHTILKMYCGTKLSSQESTPLSLQVHYPPAFTGALPTTATSG